MTSKPDVDQRLIDAHDLALAALHEITPASTVGPAADYLPEEDGSVSLPKTHVWQIRRKLRMDPERGGYIKAIPWIGYTLTRP